MSFNKRYKHNTQTVLQVFALLFLGVIAAFFVLTAGPLNRSSIRAEGEGTVSTQNSLAGYTPTKATVDEYFNTVSGSTYDKDTNPYVISTADDLRTLAYFVNGDFTIVEGDSSEEQAQKTENQGYQAKYTIASFKMTNHIDLSAWTQWEPIGTYSNPFSGSLNGDGHSIYGLTILDDMTQSLSDDRTKTYAGLFGKIAYTKIDENEYRPVIQRLGLKDTIIKTKRNYVGSIVGYALGAEPAVYGSAIDPTFNYKTESVMVGSTNVNKQYSNATAAVVIQDCYNTGYVEGGECVGGIAGALYYGAIIFNCYNSPMDKNQYNQVADVYSSIETASVGGIVGHIVSVTASYPMIRSTISTVVASKLNATVDSSNVGSIIGKKPESGDSALYADSNDYLKGAVDYTNDWGSWYYLDEFANIPDFALREFKYTAFTDNTWSNSCSTVWCLERNTNRGVPVLANVPQLVKFNFKVVEVNDGTEVEVASSEAKAGISEGAREPALVPADNSCLLYEQGQDVLVATDILKAEKYTFSKWKYSYAPDSIETSVYEFTPNTIDATTEIMRASALHDCTLVAMLGYTSYDVKLSVNNAEKYESLLINGESYTIGSTVSAKYTDIIEFTVNAKPGWQVIGWQYDTTQEDINSSTFSLSMADYVDGVLTGGSDIPTTVNVQAILAIKSYSIIIQSSNDSYGSVSAKLVSDDSDFTANTIQYDTTIELTAAALDEYHEFSVWTITVGGEEFTLDNPNALSIRFTVGDAGNIIITANFDKKKFNVSASASMVGGEASVTSATSSEITSSNFYYDETVVITANAFVGYEFVGYKVNDTVITQSTDYIIVDMSNRTLTLVLAGIGSAVTYEALFDALTYSVTVNVVDENGEPLANAATITVSETTPADDEDKFVYNTMVIFNIALANGIDYIGISSPDCIVSVTTDSNGLPVQMQFTITKDSVITVTLKQHLYNVDVLINVVASNGMSFDTSCVTGNGQYKYNEVAQIAINIPAMFEFYGSDGLTLIISGGSSMNILNYGLNNNVLTFSRLVTNDLQFTAKFKIKTTRVNFTAVGDENGSNWFTVDGVSSLMPIAREYGKTVSVQVTNEYLTNRAGKYVFSHWEIDGVPVSTSTTLNFTVKGDVMNVKGVFEPVDLKVITYVVRWNEQTGSYEVYNDAGTVEGLTTNLYKYGDKITINAQTNEGYRFVGWYKKEGELNSRGTFITASNTISSLSIEQSLTLYANYEHVSRVSVQLSDLDAGRITGAGEYIDGSRVTLNAEANEGYRFVKWTSNGLTVSENTSFSFNIRNDIAFNAVFEPVFTISLISSNDSYGKIIGNTSGKYSDSIVLQAVSENNCSFVGWVINDVVVSTADKLTISVNGDMEVHALFKKNFDWNILIILAGCALFAIVLIAGSAAYIKMKEAEPMPVRVLLNSKDDKDALQKAPKRDKYRDKIEPVPTRKNTKANVAPIPVRKITVAPINHKGELMGRAKKASEQTPTLKTDVEMTEKPEVKVVEEPKTTKVQANEKPKTSANPQKSKKGKNNKKVNQR